MSKVIDLVYALAWWAYQRLTAFLGISDPYGGPHPSPWVITKFQDCPETQETLAKLVAALDDEKAVSERFRNQVSDLMSENDWLVFVNDELNGANKSLETHLSNQKAENDELRELNSQLTWALDGHHGVQPTGPSRPNNNRKLTSTEVQEIRDMKRRGWTNVELAESFDVNRATISRIVRNQYHKSA